MRTMNPSRNVARNLLAAIIVASVFCLPAHSQETTLSRQMVGDAMDDARTGSLQSMYDIKDKYGDKALVFFKEARFDKSVDVGRGAIAATGESYESLLFLLPMIQDQDEDIALSALGRTTSLFHPPAMYQRLNPDDVVAVLRKATTLRPSLVEREPSLLLLLQQYPHSANARALLNQLLRQHKWTYFPATTKWTQEKFTALLTQCETGSTSPERVISVVGTTKDALFWFLPRINLLKSPVLRRYAVEMLFDDRPFDTYMDGKPHLVSTEAERYILWATGVELNRKVENGRSRYKADDIQAVYHFYGLLYTEP